MRFRIHLICFLFFVAMPALGQICYQFSGPGVDSYGNPGTFSAKIDAAHILPSQSLPGLPAGEQYLTYAFYGGTLNLSGFAVDDSPGIDGAAISYGGATSTFDYIIITLQLTQSFTMMTISGQNLGVGPAVFNMSITGIGNLFPNGLTATMPPTDDWLYCPSSTSTCYPLSSDNGALQSGFGIHLLGTSAPATFAGTVTSIGSCSASQPPPPDSTTAKLFGNCQCSSAPNTPPPPAGQLAVADPITISNGNLFEQQTDYQTSGANPLSFTRYYNSQGSSAPVTSPAKTLGNNWRSSYDRYLILNSATSVTADRANGQQLNFTLTNGAWTTDSDVDVNLVNSGATWTLIDSTDTTETYTVSGSSTPLLKTIQSRNGYTQTLSYNSSGQPTSITDSYNRSLSLAYSGSQLQSVTTPDALVITYGFTSATGGSQLTKVTYSTSPATSRSYVYENTTFPFALTGIIDENGNRYSTWTYDSSGRALTSKLGSNAALTTIVYNTDGSRIVTNALGVTDTYLFTTLQGVPKVTEIDRAATSTTAAAKQLFSYDANGYTASQTDWNGNVTTYVNNPHGLPTTINEAVGTAQARTTTITYDPTWVRLPSVIVTPGLTTSFTYDSNGEVLQETLTDTTTSTVPYATGGQSRTWTYTWANSLLASSQGPRTDVQELTKFAYDSTGALTAATNALGQTTKITQHTPGGLPQTIVDPNGVVTNLTYDGRQRPVSSALTTSAGVLTTKYAYDAAGNLITTTLPDGSALTNSYDAAHRLTGVTDLFKQSIAYTLDALGDPTQTNIANATGAIQRKHSGTFDALGRILQDIGGVGQTTTFSYDSNGNAIAVTDPLTHKTQAAFDALNRPVTSTDPAGNVTFTSYDAHDRPISITDPNGGTTSYTYNGFGDLIQQVSPTTGTTVYRYDPAGNQIQRIDARGVTTNWTYDALDRVVTIVYPGNSAENVTYTYDQTGHGFGIGRLTSLTDASGTLSRSYDERGDILSETRVQGAVTLSTTYTYDAAQRVISMGYPSGWTTAYTRDSMGRITGISTKAAGATATPSTVVSGITYQPFGPPNALSYSNGVTETRTLDADYRETLRSDTGKSPLQKLSYAYDLANNVSSITDAVIAANSQAFSYDALNRLITANGSYGKLGYTYDAIGNRVSDSSSVAPSTLDGLGTLNTLTYNQSGRVSTVTAGTTQIAGYSYDAFGHRLARSGASAGLYQYDLSSHLIEETDGQGNPQADYIYLGDQPIASIAPGSGHVYFLHDDRQGTPQVATDTSQTVMWQANYQPFGATSTSVGLITQDLRLPGQEFDSVTGWNHNGFREYVPAWGRYSQSDPVGIRGGVNTYSYATGNPLNKVDSDGLRANIILFSPGTVQYQFAVAINVNGFSIAGHGNPDSIAVGEPSAPGSTPIFEPYDAAGISQLIAAAQGAGLYHSGDPIYLFSCSTAGTPALVPQTLNFGPRDSIAQQLADRWNTVVYAPDTDIWLGANGTYIVAPPTPETANLPANLQLPDLTRTHGLTTVSPRKH